jgi:hypothetical protein
MARDKALSESDIKDGDATDLRFADGSFDWYVQFRAGAKRVSLTGKP